MEIILSPMAIFIILLVVCAVTDWRKMIIPNWAVLVGAVVGVISAPLGIIPGTSVMQAVLGVLLCGGGLLLISLIAYRLMGRAALGMGDVKLVSMSAIFLGAPRTFLGILIASFLGIIYACAVYSRTKEWRELPFGTFLAIGFILCVFYGEQLVALYLTHIGIM